MANKSLTDLTARTATADSDLIHVNSGGTDYKETKGDFCKDIVQYVELSNQSSITSQVDTLAGTVKSPSFYAGKINSYGSGPAAVTGAPVANSGHLLISIYSGSYVRIEFTEVDGQYRSYEKFKHGGTWDSQWTQLPSRAEITSLNNSLANIGKQVISRYESVSVGASLAYTGMYFNLTKTSIVRVSQYYTYSTPQAIAICSSSSGNQGIYAHAEALSGVTNVYITCSTVLGAGTYYVWAKASSSATNNIALLAVQIEP